MRTPDGRFARGNKLGKGRPPRNYSIAHALSVAADQPQSIDNDGNPLTDAQLAARWLWQVVREGIDVRKSADGDEIKAEVATRDRLHALQMILSRIEPEYKIDPKKLDELDEDEQREIVARLEKLSDAELAVLEKLGMKGGGT